MAAWGSQRGMSIKGVLRQKKKNATSERTKLKELFLNSNWETAGKNIGLWIQVITINRYLWSGSNALDAIRGKPGPQSADSCN
jgi:hypothetical protein